MSDVSPRAGRASKPLDSYDECASCGAVLKDVPFEGDHCPHCGYDLKNAPPTFGQAAQAARTARERAQGGPER